MIRNFSFVLTLFGCVLSFSIVGKTQTGEMTMVADDRIENPGSAIVSPSEEEFLKNEVVRAFKLKIDSECARGFSVSDAAEGHFTSREAGQKAYLYSLCDIDNNSVIRHGIIVAENGKIAAHYTFEDIGAKRLTRLTDINDNGFDEIVFHLVEEEAGGIAIIELMPGGVKLLGCHQTFLHTSKTEIASTIYVLRQSATTGKKAPEFYEEKFSRQKGAWRKIKSPARVVFNPECWETEIFKAVW
jgi:hypothetical protein